MIAHFETQVRKSGNVPDLNVTQPHEALHNSRGRASRPLVPTMAVAGDPRHIELGVLLASGTSHQASSRRREEVADRAMLAPGKQQQIVGERKFAPPETIDAPAAARSPASSAATISPYALAARAPTIATRGDLLSSDRSPRTQSTAGA